MFVQTKAICILGMHRSGTSTIARAINLMGAYLGRDEELLPPAPDNPEGFWERKDIVALHDRILCKLRRNWDTTVPLPEDWFLSREFVPFKEKVVELVGDHLSSHEVWAWKDPRTCLTLPLWKLALNELGIDLSCIFVFRSPVDVANSLSKRNGFATSKSLGIYLNYCLSALESLSDVPVMFVSYPDFLFNWESELERCADFFGLACPQSSPQLKEELTTFGRPDLNHGKGASTDLAPLPIPLRQLYATLLQALASRAAPEGFRSRGLKKMTDEFRAYADFYDSDLCELWELRQHVPAMNGVLSEKSRQLAETEDRLKRTDDQINELRSQIEESLL